MADDRRLLERLKRGDKAALRAIYEKYEQTLTALAANLLDDPTLAEDVLQDVLIALVRSVHRLNLRRSLKAYLATAVANRTRDYYRRKPRQSVVSIDEARHLEAGGKGPVQMAIGSEQMQKILRSHPEIGLDADTVEAKTRELGVDLVRRPETFSPAELLELARRLL